jgi:hypothetical protein
MNRGHVSLIWTEATCLSYEQRPCVSHTNSTDHCPLGLKHICPSQTVHTDSTLLDILILLISSSLNIIFIIALKQNALTADRYLNCINLQHTVCCIFWLKSAIFREKCVYRNSDRKCVCKTYRFKTLCKMRVMYKQRLQLLQIITYITVLVFHFYLHTSVCNSRDPKLDNVPAVRFISAN